MNSWIHRRDAQGETNILNGIGMSSDMDFLKGDLHISELGETHEVRTKEAMMDLDYYRSEEAPKLEHVLTARVSFDTMDALQREAKKSNMSVSMLVNCILEATAQRWENY